jgi:hypothetical protein
MLPWGIEPEHAEEPISPSLLTVTLQNDKETAATKIAK